MANILPNSNTPSETTAKLYLNEKFADVHFVFDVNGETQKVPANKVILAVLSPVFDAMFFGSLKESREVKIVDASPEAFTEFLQFFYLDKVTLTIENMETVARLADKYDILDCVNASAAFIESLTPENMCWNYQLAIFLKNEELIDFCEKNIGKSAKEMFASEGYQRCDEKTLESILCLNLKCSETDVFNACVEWGKNACKQDGLDENRLENVKVQLGDHFKLIRFGDMTIEEFVEIHTLYKDLFTLEEFQDIMLQITSTNYESKIFDQSPRYYVWNNIKTLMCFREEDNGDKRFNNVQSVEVVSFSTNQPVLLGQLWSYKTYTEGEVDGVEVDVSVIQLEDKTFHSNNSSKELYKGAFDNWEMGLIINFPKPILIKPKTIYEIRVTKKTPDNLTYSVATWKPKIELENGLEIYFHRNPSLGYDNVSTGWIDGFVINII